MDIKIFLFLICNLFLYNVNAYINFNRDMRNPAFDPSLYEEVLDPELCKEQLSYITRNNTLLWIQFLESGLRVPRSILSGNTVDLGNYHQCLGINERTENLDIKGKYCLINAPIRQNIPEIPDWIDFNPNKLRVRDEIVKHLQEYDASIAGVRTLFGRGPDVSRITTGLGDVAFTLAVCVPKTCTTQQGINGLLFNATALGFKYEDNFCRINNDKPWVPADYVAISILSGIGLLTLLSTCYDLRHKFFSKKDSKKPNTVYQMFSVYTNARRLTTFSSNPGSLECVDGIRALAMMWVILGHTFSTLPPPINMLEGLTWMVSSRSIWITAAPISVDTFFLLSGLLVVYTTAGKLSSMKLVKNIHLYYLNRLLRMFPLLAAVLLFQVSIFHRLSDGPLWNEVARETSNCRMNWWLNLLYVQNFFNNPQMCLGHSWYLAIDIHLHIISPLILFWVLSGNKKAAWTSLIIGLLVFLTAATIYNFIMEFPGAAIAPAREDEEVYYMIYYYVNTLPRASPFFVGMIFGYLLHLRRGKAVKILKVQAVLLWLCIIILMSAAIYANEPMKDWNWDNQTVDSLVNSFMRPAWAAGLGLMIFACVHGYGGPLNWFFSLHLWKLPSRLSYGMYLFHLPIIHVISASATAPIRFSVLSTIYLFLSNLVIALVVSFVMTLIVDAPFSSLFKLLLGGATKQQPKEAVAKKISEDSDTQNENNNNKGEVTLNEADSDRPNCVVRI